MLKKILPILCLFALLLLGLAGASGAGAAEAPSFSTYVGGSGPDEGLFVWADPSNGFVALVGHTNSRDLPVFAGLPPFTGTDFTGDGFVTVFGSRGSIVTSTYVGTEYGDSVTAMTQLQGVYFVGGVAGNNEGKSPYVSAVAPMGFVRNRALAIAENADLLGMAAGPSGLWICGRWFESDFGSGSGNYVARIDPETLRPAFVAYFDDLDTESLLFFESIAVDAAGNLYVAGQAPYRESGSLFVAKLNPAGEILETFFIDGIGGASSLEIDPSGRIILAGTTASGIAHDEPAAGAASSGLGSSTPRVKAERDGNGDGRVYHITFEAADPSGASCTGEVTVCVPHDQGRKSCGDGSAQERKSS